MLTEKEIRRRTQPDLFVHIAFWQFMAFGALLSLIWASERLGFSNLLLSTAHPAPDYYRASFMSAAVILCAIITVGHTYIQQLRIIRGIVVMCAVCGKIKARGNEWNKIESYLHKYSDAVLSHGICPDCLEGQIEASEKIISR